MLLEQGPPLPVIGIGREDREGRAAHLLPREKSGPGNVCTYRRRPFAVRRAAETSGISAHL